MKTYSTRTLSLEDFGAAERVIASRDYFSSITHPTEMRKARDFHLSHTYNLLDPDVQAAGLGNVFGAFDGDVLVGLLVSLTSDAQPNYYITRAHVLSGQSGGPSLLSSLISCCIQHHERMGYFRFYSMYTASKLEAYKRLWRHSDTVAGYMSYTEMRVAANEKVKQNDFWEKLYGRMLLPEPSIVRAFIRPVDNPVFRV